MATATTTMRETGFCNGEMAIAAQLHLPPDFDQDRSWPVIVLSTPGGRVKERVGAIYARKLAARGFVAITFDPSHLDANAGAARDLEDPAKRVEDLCCAVDHLVTLPFVDEARIAVLGVCAGGGYAVDAALAEHRFKVVATVAGTDVGRTLRRMLGIDAPHLAPDLLVQPLMVIVAGRQGGTRQYETGRALYGLARGPDRALVVIAGARHHDLYHRDEHIDPAIGRLAPFFHFHLES